MLIFLLIVFAVSLAGVKLSAKGGFHEDYLSIENTTAINGIFVLLVFFKHVSGQAALSDGAVDRLYQSFGDSMGQLIVTTFLFYSGYGIMCSISSKGDHYLRSIPKNRIMKVLLHYDLALVVYILLNLLQKNKMDPLNVLLSLVGWSNIGNSNWYIFTIVAMYLAVYVSFSVFRGKIYASLAMTLAMIFGFISLMFAVRQPAYFYNTAVCYALGMVYAQYREKIEKAVMKNSAAYYITFFAVLVSFTAVSLCEHVRTFPHSLWATLFVLLVVLFTMKVRLNNPVLTYFGKRVFSVYILQRIPMIIFKKVTFIYSNEYLYVIVCFAFTLAAVELFDRLTGSIDSKLFIKKEDCRIQKKALKQ